MSMNLSLHRAPQYLSRSAVFLATTWLAGCASRPTAPTSGSVNPHFEAKETLEPMPGLKIYHYVHPASGLDVYLVPQKGSGVVALTTAYDVGSRFEVKGRTGLAHLFEHMMFRGTESFPEPFKTLSSWGGRFNAFTTSDLTLYHEQVPKEFLGDAVKFEAERMRKLMITSHGFKTERGAVISERKMSTEDAPFGRLNWELANLAYDVHPYKTGVIGWQADLDATTLEEALAFYQRYYAPNRAKISWVGDFELEEAIKILEKNYGSFTSPEWVAPTIPAEPIRKKLRRAILPMKVEGVYMADSVLGSRFGDENAHVDTMLCTLLANSKLGFLSFELVEKKIARMVAANCSPSVDRDLATIFLVGNPGVSLTKLEHAYLKARKEFPKWLTAERVEMLKLYYQADQWNALRSPTNLAQQISEYSATAGDPLYLFKMIQKIGQVTREDILKRYQTWNENPTRLFLAPSAKTPPIRPTNPTAKRKAA